MAVLRPNGLSRQSDSTIWSILVYEYSNESNEVNFEFNNREICFQNLEHVYISSVTFTIMYILCAIGNGVP